MTNTVAFNMITIFINELFSVFPKNRPLELYNYLLQQTNPKIHIRSTSKHVSVFTDFCIANRNNILRRDSSLVQPIVRYSLKVFVDFTGVWIDQSNNEIIWDHLITIASKLDPVSNAIYIKEKNNRPTPANPNPMHMISSLMSSGIFKSLLSGNDGGGDVPDISGLIQGLGGMLSAMPPPQGGDDVPNPMLMISAMLSAMSSKN